MRPDADRRHDDRKDQVARGVPLHGHTRTRHEVALRFGGRLQLAEESLLAEGEIDRTH
jgi:hypothetical protein